MADLVKKIKIKKQDGTFTDYIPIGAEAQNISTSDGDSVQLKLNKKPYYYNSVADMKADTKLKAGDMAITLGYYEVNDGGRAEYKIVSSSDSYYETLNNNLKAELIINNKINVKWFGAYGDGTHDDATALNNALNFGRTSSIAIYSPKNNTYLVGNPLNFSDITLDFNNSEIKTNSAIDIITLNSKNYYGTIEKVNINCNGVATAGIHIIEARKKYFSNINIYNIVQDGVKYDTGYEIDFNHSHLQGTSTSTTSVGLHLLGGDSHWNDIIIIDCCTAVINRALNFYTQIHAWILTKALCYHSKFFHHIGGRLKMSQCYCDTYQYCFYFSEANVTPEINCDELQLYYNSGIIKDEYMNSEHAYVFYYEEDAKGLYTNNITLSNAKLNGITLNNHSTDFSNQIMSCYLAGVRFSNVILMSWITNSITNSLNENVEYLNNKITAFGDTVTLDLAVKIPADYWTSQSDAEREILLGVVSVPFKPIIDVNFMAAVHTASQWKASGMCYCYLAQNGNLQCRLNQDIGIAADQYIKIHLTYNRTQ